jgi:hypothetical protein
VDFSTHENMVSDFLGPSTMSFISAARSGTERENTLVDMVWCFAAIEELVRPLQPLKDQLAALEIKVVEQGHQPLNIALMHVKTMLPTQTTISIVIEDAADTGDNFLPTAHKLEFPKYNDTSDPLPWLNMCAWYFRV